MSSTTNASTATTTTEIVPSITTGSSSSTIITTVEEAMKMVEVVKEQINQYDIQSSKYKTLLRNMTSATTTATTSTNINDTAPNSVTITWVKVDSGTIVESPINLVLQLSSPIEEATLSLSPQQEKNSTSTTTFHGVETGQATLGITAKWDDVTKNEKSETTYMDVSKFTHELLNVLQESSSSPESSYETTLRIPILPVTTTTTTTEESKKATTSSDTLCTITLHVKYIPSHKDVKEELCNIIGKIATQKAIAREELRKASLMVHELSSSSSSSTKNPKPSAAQSGFLQKDKSNMSSSSSSSDDANTTGDTKKGDGWYSTKAMEYYKGIMTNAMMIVPLFKNYIFFIAFTVVTHYYGHNLAIPPPV